MNTMVLSLLSVVLFCLCCLKLMTALTTKIPVFNQTGYAKAALRVEKAYRVLAWGIMTCFFLTALVVSFAEVFTGTPI